MSYNKNGNIDRSNREKYRLAPRNNHSVKTKEKVSRDRRDSSKNEGVCLGFCELQTAARIPGLNISMKKVMTSTGVPLGASTMALMVTRLAESAVYQSKQTTACAFFLFICLFVHGAQCPLAKRKALCAGSPAFLKRAWAQGMS